MNLEMTLAFFTSLKVFSFTLHRFSKFDRTYFLGKLKKGRFEIVFRLKLLLNTLFANQRYLICQLQLVGFDLSNFFQDPPFIVIKLYSQSAKIATFTLRFSLVKILTIAFPYCC